jgi:Helix-turn-helix domain
MAAKAKPIANAEIRPSTVGRTLEELLDALAPEDRAAVEARSAVLHAEVEGLKALRKLAARSQEQIAQSLGVKQPAIVKMERQTDLYLSTLRRFVEAAGGTLELRVELPGSGVLRLTGMGELNANPS